MRRITAAAKAYYVKSGSHGWNHIQKVLSNASEMKYLESGISDLNREEYTAIVFHDCSILSRGREYHETFSAFTAIKELTRLKSRVDFKIVFDAILEHRASYNGAFSSDTSCLLSSADRGAPNLKSLLSRSFQYQKENGTEKDSDAIRLALSHIKQKYGREGYARFPYYYQLMYSNDIEETQHRLSVITEEEAMELIK